MNCRCPDIDELVGNEADTYAREHLQELEVDSVNWVTRFKCPETNLEFIEDRQWSEAHGGGIPRLRPMNLDSIPQVLAEIERLLRKHAMAGQADVVRAARDSYKDHPEEFRRRVTSVDMWGGSGAVWEVCLPGAGTESPNSSDRQRFHESIVRLVEFLEQEHLPTERARSVADTFRNWRGQGL